MSSTLGQIRTALATTLSTISGLNVYASPPGTVNVPAAVILRRSGPEEETEGGSAVGYIFALSMLCGLQDQVGSQQSIDTFISRTGASSVFVALAADDTLGGVVDYAVVTTVERDQLVDYGGVTYLGCDVLVEVGA